jgi:hypothetical protein
VLSEVQTRTFCCSPKLLANIPEIAEIGKAIDSVVLTAEFRLEANDKNYAHQTGYNIQASNKPRPTTLRLRFLTTLTARLS